MANKYLDNDGVLYLWGKIKSLVSGAVPTKTSDLTNDSGFITSADVPEGATASTSTPLMDGTAAVGTSTAFARGDHVHPSDTNKVDKVTGKGLSTNDYTTAEKEKLAGIEAGAEVNVIKSITINTQTQTPSASGDISFNVPLASHESPKMDGTAAIGTYGTFARSDHVHPSDTSKVDKVSGYGLAQTELPTKTVDLAYLTAMGLTDGDANIIKVQTDNTSYETSFIKISGMATLVQALGTQLNAKANAADVVSNTTFNTAMQQANTALSNKADKSDITNMYKYKGSVATVSALPSSGQTTGDVYNVEATGMNYAWNGSAWDALGEIFTITAITNSELDTICV